MTADQKAELLRLDSAGFLPAPGESREEFFIRTGEIIRVHKEFDERIEQVGSADVFDFVTVRSSDKIAPELVDDVARQTWELYGFAVRHVPGFYLTKAVGLLWGGCMLSDPDENFSIMLLRNAFKNHRRFLSYTRDELLAHELCHSVRQSLCEITLEEYFAYQTAKSPLRRYLGNCFIRDVDALLFVIPMLLLPVAEVLKALVFPGLPVWAFWILAVIYPVFLLVRNWHSRRIVNRVRSVLKRCNVRQAEAVLFRSTLAELKTLVGFDGGAEEFRRWAAAQAENELRWQVIVARFIDEDELDMQEKGACCNEDS